MSLTTNNKPGRRCNAPESRARRARFCPRKLCLLFLSIVLLQLVGVAESKAQTASLHTRPGKPRPAGDIEPPAPQVTAAAQPPAVAPGRTAGRLLDAQPTAQSSPDTTARPPMRLLDALRAAAGSETVIAVGADRRELASDAAPPTPGQPLDRTAASFGCATSRIGTLVAVLPRTLVVLSHGQGQPDLYRDIPPQEAFTLLAASLTDTQRDAILSPTGLGLADLLTPMQRGLFLTLFPARRLVAKPRAAPGQPEPGPDRERRIDEPMQNSRLRIGAAVRFAVYTVGGDTPTLTPAFAVAGGPRMYEAATQDHLFTADTVNGLNVRWTEDNVLKKGDLDLNAPALQAQVPLDGIKTVANLVARIAAHTRLELIADRRYEDRTVTLVHPSATARASDLLKALCLCVTGTFRRVGPACVLTEDIAGVGARRSKIADFQADSDARRAAPLKQAADRLQETGAFWKVRLNGFGDPLMPTPLQWKNEETGALGAGAVSVVRLDMEQLTPLQQQALQDYSEGLRKLHDERPNEGYPLGVDFDRQIELELQPAVELLIPTLDAPVDTGLGPFVAEVFRDMSKFRVRPAGAQTSQPASAQAPGALANVIEGIPRRALLTNARTVEALDATVADMKRLHLNQLWLPVFTNGIAYLPGTPFSPPNRNVPDLLDHALKITQGQGITVYPVIDLLAWGASVSADVADVTITGATSVQAENRQRERQAIYAAASGDLVPFAPTRTILSPLPPPAQTAGINASQLPDGRSKPIVSPLASAPPKMVVSPLAPEVRRDLSLVLKAVADRTGLARFVWRETCPPGYDLPDRIQHREPHARLGYTAEARLAFLRRFHADPIDITPLNGLRESFERADTSLPAFDDVAIDQALDREWNAFCTRSNVQLLDALFDVAAGTGTGSAKAAGITLRVPAIFVRERRDNFGWTWYGAWAGPNTPLPTNHMSFEDGRTPADLKPAPTEIEQAHAQSRINLLRLPIGRTLDEALLTRQWADTLRNLQQNKSWEGFVLEMDSLPP